MYKNNCIHKYSKGKQTFEPVFSKILKFLLYFSHKANKGDSFEKIHSIKNSISFEFHYA